MKKRLSIFLYTLLITAWTACDSPTPASKEGPGSTDSAATTTTGNVPAADQAHNSNNSLDWDGIYRGVLPCADCPGIQTTIYLNRDLTYLRRTKYLERPVTPADEKGKFTWNAEGNTITLESASGPAKYFVGERTLTQLDLNGAKITGDLAANYVLSKDNYAILYRRWKLVELNGQPIAVDSSFAKEPFLTLIDSTGRASGNGSCNTFSGQFETGPLNRIKFSKMISTRMFCKNMEIETKYLKALEMADNFTVSGDELVLNRARMAPLARFKSAFH
ncbi:copper resistance protein NlpE N-terminal domain-containing protein [Paraflavitalea sp. CAU 1676]|uniref:copper resistance protein NlpE N-terminal domain-containing protein n=1 Tax=Paraflavitalea sp. CAU 1676 TaxID=3032598 RepID=UPI0023DA9DC7|nr:copper resistance protein NlpE N-terminal domain-containing protein [Paraflavitalea sp. CAU 1676]MDF2189867.1 copper resistance protein NlpE N-terminal domain-containing protein [Paraflavitalea sp. CAU 1676]